MNTDRSLFLKILLLTLETIWADYDSFKRAMNNPQ